jgi:hypothetical protein
MHRKIFRFIRSRPFDIFGLTLFSFYFIRALHDHSATAAYGYLGAICGMISTLLGPNFSLKLTLPEIYQAFRNSGVPRYQKIRRVLQYLCFALLGLCLYSAFTTS